jgi:hypothetical protein
MSCNNLKIEINLKIFVQKDTVENLKFSKTHFLEQHFEQEPLKKETSKMEIIFQQ